MIRRTDGNALWVWIAFVGLAGCGDERSPPPLDDGASPTGSAEGEESGAGAGETTLPADATTSSEGGPSVESATGSTVSGATTGGDTEPPDPDTDGPTVVPGDPGELPGRVPLDCGPDGVAIVDAGPTTNRVNYVIIGDGYTAGELDTTFLDHVDFAMVKRFDEVIGQPYLRYRDFVNICAIKLASDGPICGESALGCCGDDDSRLARCDGQAADQAMAAALPEAFEIDWKAVVLNGDRWWNTGSALMLWSGGHADADGAALHEGGHGFHRLADEYAGTSTNGCTEEHGEVNSTADGERTAGKWDRWLGFDQVPGTGMQDIFEASRYCDRGQFRPSDNSMMNSLFGDDPDTAFNPVSREKIVMDIWRVVEPIDAAEPPPGPVTDPPSLTVWVIDPEVIDVDWYVDGELVAADGGGVLDLHALALPPGEHVVEARAYDNAGEDLVRYRDGGDFGRENWARAQQSLTWTVTTSSP